MNQFETSLLEEFGQEAYNHVMRNKGKYAIGAGATGLGGYAAYNGNLGSAINTGADYAGMATGIAVSPVQTAPGDYGKFYDKAKADISRVYNADEDPEIPFSPIQTYDIGNGLGKVAARFQPEGMYESEDLSLDEEEEESHVVKNVAKATAGVAIGGAAVTAAMNADKIGKAGKKIIANTKDSVSKNIVEPVKDMAKAKAENATSSLGNALLKASRKIRGSRTSPDNVKSDEKYMDAKIKAESKGKADGRAEGIAAILKARKLAAKKVKAAKDAKAKKES